MTNGAHGLRVRKPVVEAHKIEIVMQAIIYFASEIHNHRTVVRPAAMVELRWEVVSVPVHLPTLVHAVRQVSVQIDKKCLLITLCRCSDFLIFYVVIF